MRRQAKSVCDVKLDPTHSRRVMQTSASCHCSGVLPILSPGVELNILITILVIKGRRGSARNGAKTPRVVISLLGTG